MPVPDYDDRLRRFHVACGQTVRAWALLEQSLFMIFEMFFIEEGDTDNDRFRRQFRLRIVWHSQVTYNAKKLLLKKLAESFLSDDDAKILAKLLQRCSGLASRRNALAHCVGGIDSETGEVFLMSDAPDENIGFKFFGTQRFQLTNVENWPKDIETLQTDILKSIASFSVHASSKMHRESPRG